jgi:NAD(P)-dependent dehydrogenase (short-subunit alcohol dehydrogenase family)
MPDRVAVILGGSGFVGRHLAPRLAAHGWLGRARGRAAVGQETFTFRELLERMLAHLGKQRLILPVPFGLAGALAAGLERLPDPPLTREEVRLLRTDKVAGELPTPARLGITARPLRAGLPDALRAGR